ncbi:YihY/virulence factor BrkB family protein [Streptomonospora sp. PA3]|uniref:YihY/virulence factor BrkB family protein n=1 Tax=Streptomonospora sp. PA3 TaxID=2607326 RepID=UPI0012DF9226|nr:YihY/virulence factor BrkB family protein [Streptomonospora sp. PA3]MUL43731.1 YihY/virulence factor BrkB family protein [Streptomonospora sp. PA3]
MAASHRSTENGSATREASAPTQLPARSWWGSLRRTVAEFRADNLTDLAAALTYYGILSIFPALLVLVSLLGFAGQSATQALTSSLSAAPADVAGFLTTIIQNMQRNQAAAGIFGLIGLVVALWSASGYIAAFMRASNVVYDVPEGRPIYKTLPIRLGVTLLMVVLLTAAAVAVVLTGALAEQAGQLLGLGPVTVMVWRIAKWPVLLLVVMFMIAVLYWASPNAKRGFRWVSPGSVLAVVIWLLASGAFALYLATFASYSQTYGSMAAVIIFLVWLWITNIAILLGEEFNSEIQRGRALAEGHPEDEEPYVEMRDVPKQQRREATKQEH